MFRDKSRNYHETFNQGGSRRMRGDNIQREVSIGFIDAVKGVTIGKLLLMKI